MADIASGILYTRPRFAWRSPHRRNAARRLRGGRSAAKRQTRRGYSPSGLPLMKAIKARWDPSGLFNPGALIV